MCLLIKADVVPPLTLALNEKIIVCTIDILWTIAICFGFIDKIVNDRVVMI